MEYVKKCPVQPEVVHIATTLLINCLPVTSECSGHFNNITLYHHWCWEFTPISHAN
jgi:hypothetical protein